MKDECRIDSIDAGPEELPCLMPGCQNKREPGRRLCRACLGEDAPASPAHEARGADAQSDRPAQRHVLLGVDPNVQLLPGKKRIRAHNRLPREWRTCPCGKRFPAVVGGYRGTTQQYCSNPCKLKYFCPPTGALRRGAKWLLSPEADELIRELYQSKVGVESVSAASPVKDLAEKLGVPRWKVTRRAQHLGVIAKQRKDPEWSAEEIAILKEYSHRSLERIALRLKDAGFSRTVTAIGLKRRRLGGHALVKGYSAHELAGLFGIDMHAIRRWIERGLLVAERRGTHRTAAQGGDTYYITTDNVRDFVRACVHMVDFRKLDKVWLVEVLTQNQNQG